MHFDTPISFASEDLYNRRDSAKRIAKMLYSIKNDSSVVVGLTGSWGMGKTSFLNMIKEILREDANGPIVIDFNAWLYSTQEQLIRRLFAILKQSIESANPPQIQDSVKELGSTLIEYSDAIAEAGSTAVTAMSPVPVISTVVPLVKAVAKSIFKHGIRGAGKVMGGRLRTTEQLRADISELLSKLDSNIVVLIDDVDRLPKEEICALFKLVNLTASFPRMTFLLSYDAGVVCEALNDIQGISGHDYLEKIINLPINLPLAPPEAIRSQLAEALEPAFDSEYSYATNDYEHVRTAKLFEDLLLRRIDTPRRAKRYLNVFEMLHAAIGKELSPCDTMCAAAIVLIYPHVADWLWSNRHFICSGEGASREIGLDNSERLKESFSQAASNDSPDPMGLLDTLTEIFPRLILLKNEASGRPMSISRETGRIAHIDNLSIVFGIVSPDDLMRRTALQELVRECDEVHLTRELKHLNDLGGLSRFVDTTEYLSDALTIERKRVITRAILSSLGAFEQYEEPHVLHRTTAERVSRLLRSLLRDCGTSVADALLEQAMDHYTFKDYMSLSWFLRDESLAQSGGDDTRCLSETSFSIACSRYIDAIITHYPEVMSGRDHPAKFQWRHLDEPLGGNALQTVREKYGNDTTMRILYASSALAHWYSGYSDGYGRSRDPDSNYAPVLNDPTVETVNSFGQSKAMAELPAELQIRVASLYLLLTEAESADATMRDIQIPRQRAQAVLEDWRASAQKR